MRNRTTRHRNHYPQQEWSKIVRFNGRSYPMNAVYDRDPGMDLDDGVYNDEHELDPSPEDLETGISLEELPWMRALAHRHRPFRINEGFFDDFGEEIFAEQNKKTQAQILAERTPYPMTDEQGNDFDVRMSNDAIKNSIFHLISSIIIVENCQGFDSIDDFLVTGGKMNEINTYKMMISGLAYRSGQFYFIAVPVKSGSRNYLQIYFTTEKDAIFRIYHKDIGLHRPKDQIVMNYDQLCQLSTRDVTVGSRKDAQDYFSKMLQNYIKQAVGNNVSVTLLKRFGNISRNQMNGTPVNDMKVLTDNFQTLTKFSHKSQGNMGTFLQTLNKDMDFIQNRFDGNEEELMLDDQYWVLIGGWEGYMQTLFSSIWASRNLKSDVFHSSGVRFTFYTPNKEVPMLKDEHNVLLVPLSVFALALQGLIMFGIKQSSEIM